MVDLNLILFGSCLAVYELRREKGLSQKELGALIGVSNKAVSKWETGASAPKTETIIKLAAVLGVTAEELLCGKQQEFENLNTLEALSNKTANMYLQEKLREYEKDNADKAYKKAKTYLICVFSLFIAVTILILTIYVAVSTGGYIEKSNIFMSFAMGYLIASVYTGITLFVDIIKKIPDWLIALLCVLFPIAFLTIEVTGFVMCIPQIVKSVQILIKSRKEKDKNG